MKEVTEQDLKKLEIPFAPHEIKYRILRAGIEYGTGDVEAYATAYIDSRSVISRLNWAVGRANYRTKVRNANFENTVEFYDKSKNKKDHRHEFVAGFIASIEIKVNGEWICREDGSDITQIEKFKGGISSAKKRAGVDWGIGAYLYQLDDIRVKTGDQNKYPNKGSFWNSQTNSKVWFSWKKPSLPLWAYPDPNSDALPYEIDEIEKMLPNLHGKYKEMVMKSLDGKSPKDIDRGTAMKVLSIIRNKIDWNENKKLASKEGNINADTSQDEDGQNEKVNKETGEIKEDERSDNFAGFDDPDFDLPDFSEEEVKEAENKPEENKDSPADNSSKEVYNDKDIENLI